MIIAFFDFDGTITKKDTFLDFVQFALGKRKMIKGVFLHLCTLLGYKLGVISGHKAKEKLLTYFFEGTAYSDFTAQTTRYCRDRLPALLKAEALEKIAWHKSQGHKVIVVTAAIKEWVKPWCDTSEIDVLATLIVVKDGLLTGKLLGKNCVGIEKVNCIQAALDPETITYSYGYGNSKGDRELLQFVDKKFYKVF